MKPEVWVEAELEAVRRGLLEKGGNMTIQEEIEQRGRQKERRAVVLNMIQKKFDISVISEATGLPEEEIHELKNGQADAQNGQAE